MVNRGLVLVTAGNHSPNQQSVPSLNHECCGQNAPIKFELAFANAGAAHRRRIC
jgi:hypothetical protein